MEERVEAAGAVAVGLAVAVTAAAAMLRVEMGQPALYKATGRVVAMELAAGFPSHFA